MKKKIFYFLFFIFFHISILFSYDYSDKSNIVTNFLWLKFLNLPKNIRPKIGLALGGGGARGLAHIGVLKALEEAKIPIDMIAGTSIGSVIGGLYVSNVELSELENLAEDVEWDKLLDISYISIIKLMLKENFISSEKMEKYLSEKIIDNDFSKTKIPFACIGSDIQTGERIVFKEGDLILAIRASSSIPGLFKPVEYRHRYIVDGGILDNLPADIAKTMGADFVIGVNVQGDFTLNKLKRVMSILNQVISMQGDLIGKNSTNYSDIIINPNVGDIDRMDLKRGKECITIGYLETKNMIEQIKKALITKYFNLIVNN